MKKAFLIIIILLTACNRIYKEPIFSQIENSMIVNKNFDETWNELIKKLAQFYFGIDKFEKESGLITINFSIGSNITDYITGGYIDFQHPLQNYKGDYVNFSGTNTLEGKINIVVEKIDNNRTKIIVNVRYVYVKETLGTIYTYTFNTNSFDKKIIEDNFGKYEVLICPTHKLEKDILNMFL